MPDILDRLDEAAQNALNHEILRAARDEIERLRDLLDQARQACEDRADVLDEMGLEMECCVGTARNCASDVAALIAEGE